MKHQDPTRNYMQEIFYTCKEGLLNQRQKTRKISGAHPLIDEYGNRCALGFLLSDEFVGSYKCNFSDMSDHMNIPIDFLSQKKCVSMLRQLQKLHDYSPVYDWPRGLKTIQAIHDIPELEVIA